jgi:hypothetical protein
MEWHPFYYKGEETNIEVNELGQVRRVYKEWMKLKRKDKLSKLNLMKNGYLCVSFRTRNFQKWLMVHQIMAIVFYQHNPNGHILVVDHIDRDTKNNNITNLRLVTSRENSANKKIVSKFGTGVQKLYNKFQSRIEINGKTIYLGLFNTANEASETYHQAVKQIEAGTFNKEAFKKKI